MYSRLTACAVALALSAGYVGAFTVARPTSLHGLSRDHRQVVLFRIRRVLVYLAVVVVGLPFLLHQIGGYPSPYDAFHAMGLVPDSISGELYQCGRALLSIVTLYAGPIYLHLLETPLSEISLVTPFATLGGFRDHIFGPVSEELVYRAGILATVTPAFASVAWTPLLFGVAHAHHAADLHRRGIEPAIIAFNTALQLAYTAMFGAYAARLFVRSHSVWPPVVVHVVCNLMGLPELHAASRLYYVLVVFGVVAFGWLW